MSRKELPRGRRLKKAFDARAMEIQTNRIGLEEGLATGDADTPPDRRRTPEHLLRGFHYQSFAELLDKSCDTSEIPSVQRPSLDSAIEGSR